MSPTWIASSLLILFAFPGTDAGAPATFHDARLKLTYRYPSEFKADDGMAKGIMAGAGSDASDTTKKVESCMRMPLAALDQNGDSGLLLLLSLDLECLGTTAGKEILPSMANGALTQGLGKLGLPSVGEATPYQLSGHDATLVDGTANSPDGTKKTFGEASCVMIEHSAVCWVAVSNDRSKVQAAMGGTVTFDGESAGHPLAPAASKTPYYDQQ